MWTHRFIDPGGSVLTSGRRVTGLCAINDRINFQFSSPFCSYVTINVSNPTLYTLDKLAVYVGFCSSRIRFGLFFWSARTNNLCFFSGESPNETLFDVGALCNAFSFGASSQGTEMYFTLVNKNKWFAADYTFMANVGPTCTPLQLSNNITVSSSIRQCNFSFLDSSHHKHERLFVVFWILIFIFFFLLQTRWNILKLIQPCHGLSN